VDILSIINQDYYKKRFGIIVRLLRVRYRYTLRGLSEQVHLSHAYLRKIELANTSINRKVYDRLMGAFNFHIEYDAALEHEFYDQWKTFNQSVIHLNKTGYDSAYSAIMEKAKRHKHSLWMVEYLLLSIGYKFQTLDYVGEDYTQVHDELLSVEPLLDDSTKQFYYWVLGNYYYHIGDLLKSRRMIERIFTIDASESFLAIAYYLIGLSHSLTFSLKKGNRYLRKALRMFQEQHNYLRQETITVFIEVNQMKMAHFENVEKTFNQGLEAGKASGLSTFVRYVLYNYAIYHLKRGQPEEALHKLERIDVPSYRVYFYKAYIHHKMNDSDTVLASIEEASRKVDDDYSDNLMHFYGMMVLKAFHINDDSLMEQYSSVFFDECMLRSGYFEIDIAYHFYKRHLIDRRRYKDAYKLANRMIAMTKKAFD